MAEVKTIKLIIAAGGAKPTPPLGPALGQAGVNIKKFCDEFNSSTSGMAAGMPLPTVITVNPDKSFTYITKTPPASYLLMQNAKLKKGSSAPGRETIGEIDAIKIKEIAEMKMQDLNARTIGQAMKIIEGSARSMGLKVKGMEALLAEYSSSNNIRQNG